MQLVKMTGYWKLLKYQTMLLVREPLLIKVSINKKANDL